MRLRVCVYEIPCSYYIGDLLVYMLIVSTFGTTPPKLLYTATQYLKPCECLWCVCVCVVCVCVCVCVYVCVCVWYVLTTHQVQGPILRINGDHVSILHKCNGTTIIRLRSYMTDHDTWRKTTTTTKKKQYHIGGLHQKSIVVRGILISVVNLHFDNTIKVCCG